MKSTKCPICKKTIKEGDMSVKIHILFPVFCSKECADKFREINYEFEEWLG